MSWLSSVWSGVTEVAHILSGKGRRVPDLRDLSGGEQGKAYLDWHYRPKRDLQQWPWLCDDMLCDPTLYHVMRLTHSHLLGAGWEWVPGSAYAWEHIREAQRGQRAGVGSEGGVMTEDVVGATTSRASAAALRYADFANRNFGLSGHSPRLARSFEEVVGGVLEFTDRGWKTAEALYKAEGGQIWINDYRPIPTHSHRAWVRQGGVIVGETFHGIERAVHLDKLLVLSHMPRPNDLRGYGALWAAYDWWTLKQHAFDLLGIGAERWTLPTPVLNVDRLKGNQLGYSPQHMDAMVALGRQLAEEYKGGRGTWLMSNPGVNLDIFANSAWTPKGLLEIVGECDKQQASAYMLRSVLMGTNAVAPRASLEGHQADYRGAAGNNLDHIALRMSGRPGLGRGHMGRVIEWNSSEPVDPNDLPILIHTGIKVDPILELVPHMESLARGGFLTPDNRTEQRLRKVWGDNLPHDSRRTPEERRLASAYAAKGDAANTDGADDQAVEPAA